MSPYHKKQRQKKRKKIFRKWHRRLGFASSLFLFNLAITGLLLNHHQLFSLHQRYITSSWLLDWYEVQPPHQFNCLKFPVSIENAQHLCQLGEQLYLTNKSNESHLFLESSSQLVNLVSKQELLYLVTGHYISIFTNKLQLIDQLDVATEFSTDILTAGLVEDQFIIETERSFYLLDEENFELLEQPEQRPSFALNKDKQWVTLEQKEIIAALGKSYRERQITQLKLVQDLHSGQIFSIQGKVLTDIVAIILLLLAISGFITWQRRKNSPPG